MKQDYKPGEEVRVINLPAHIERLNLIGQTGTVNMNNPYEAETPLQVYIGGREDYHLYHFNYENVEPAEENKI